MPLSPGSMPGLADFLIGAYTQVVGLYFWVFILFLTVGAVYVRTRSFGPTYMVLAVGAIILEAVLPGGPIHGLVFFSIVIGITYSAYRFLSGRR